MRYRGLIILTLVGGGFIWLAVGNHQLAMNDVGLQLLIVCGMVVVLILLALVSAIAIRAIIQRFNNPKK